jgi:hypothetical protein
MMDWLDWLLEGEIGLGYAIVFLALWFVVIAFYERRK